MNIIRERFDQFKKLRSKKGVLVIGLLLFVASALAVSALIDSEEFSFDTNATATNLTLDNETQLGVVTDPTLEFGEVPMGAQITKKLQVDSRETTLAHLQSTGNISEHLEYSEKILFENNTEIEVKFNATESGYYEGTVEMTAQTAKRPGGEKWLQTRSRLP